MEQALPCSCRGSALQPWIRTTISRWVCCYRHLTRSLGIRPLLAQYCCFLNNQLWPCLQSVGARRSLRAIAWWMFCCVWIQRPRNRPIDTQIRLNRQLLGRKDTLEAKLFGRSLRCGTSNRFRSQASTKQSQFSQLQKPLKGFNSNRVTSMLVKAAG